MGLFCLNSEHFVALRLLLTGVVFGVAAVLVVVAAAGPLVEVFGAAAEFEWVEVLEMLSPVTVELLNSAPKVKRRPGRREINTCYQVIRTYSKKM